MLQVLHRYNSTDGGRPHATDIPLTGRPHVGRTHTMPTFRGRRLSAARQRCWHFVDKIRMPSVNDADISWTLTGRPHVDVHIPLVNVSDRHFTNDVRMPSVNVSDRHFTDDIRMPLVNDSDISWTTYTCRPSILLTFHEADISKKSRYQFITKLHVLIEHTTINISVIPIRTRNINAKLLNPLCFFLFFFFFFF